MPWGRMDDKFHRNRKVRKLKPRKTRVGREALGLWAWWWSWCLDDEDLTGIVPADELEPAEVKLAAKLVDAGLWDEVDDGYRFHDFEEYNPTRDKLDAKRAADRERQRKRRAGVSQRDTDRDSPRDTGSDTDATSGGVASRVRVPDARVPGPNPTHTQPNPDPPVPPEGAVGVGPDLWDVFDGSRAVEYVAPLLEAFGKGAPKLRPLDRAALAERLFDWQQGLSPESRALRLTALVAWSRRDFQPKDKVRLLLTGDWAESLQPERSSGRAAGVVPPASHAEHTAGEMKF